MELTKTLARISESYFFTVVAREAKRLAEADYKRILRRQLRNMQFDKKSLLRRAGLTTYSPIRTTVGSSLLFIGGAAAGAFLGLSLAPMRGKEFRKQIKSYGVLGGRGFQQTQAPAQA